MKAITSYIDVAQVMLYLFWIFFAGLIFYLRREDRREGYPLFSEPSNTYKDPGFLWIPPPKVFRLPHGGTATAPNAPDDRAIKAAKIGAWPGAPLEPIGDPMMAAVGPGAYAERNNAPDLTVDGRIKIVPMRADRHYAVDAHDRDPRGFTVTGADKRQAGTVREIWVDRSELIIRYLEETLSGPNGRSVLLPMTFCRIDRRRGNVHVQSIFASQFAGVPALANSEQVTRLEEDKVCAYYGAGTLYATPSRTEPIL